MSHAAVRAWFDARLSDPCGIFRTPMSQRMNLFRHGVFSLESRWPAPSAGSRNHREPGQALLRSVRPVIIAELSIFDFLRPWAGRVKALVRFGFPRFRGWMRFRTFPPRDAIPTPESTRFGVECAIGNRRPRCFPETAMTCVPAPCPRLAGGVSPRREQHGPHGCL